MKKQVINTATIIALAIGTISFIGCSGSENSHNEAEKHEHHGLTEDISAETEGHAEHAHVHYQCPMDCENGKVYEEAGSCTVCGMDLVEVNR